MKTPFLRALFLAAASAPATFAFSLYDIAPPVGMPESYAVRYNVYASVGYDDNLNASSYNKEGGMFYQAGAGASYSDQEAATRISYNVNLGARLYDKKAENTGRELTADCGLNASLSHNFSPRSSYTTRLSAHFSPDLNLSDSITSGYSQGETINWTWSHAYSRAIDARWSWTVNLAYSGVLYLEKDYQPDDREYLTGGLTLSYRYSSLTTYSISTSYRHDMRHTGEDSENVYLNLGVQHSLSPISSVYATVGVQCKLIEDNTDLYPSIRLGYRRAIMTGLSANVYFSLDNENIGTGYSYGSTYLSDQTMRFGARLNYAYTHKVNFHADASLLNREYSKHTGGAADRSDTTWVLSAGMGYKFTEHLSGHITYQYTHCDRTGGNYDRNRITTGLVYSF